MSVADNRQYLRVGLQGTDYLLPNSANYTIEKREVLEVNPAGGPIAAWQATPGGRWPAYSVDANLNPYSRSSWQRAVFLQSGSQSVGLVADELQLLPREEVRVEKFSPLGPAATPVGHLLSGAWIRSGRAPVLVFDPAALAVYLRHLGNKQ